MVVDRLASHRKTLLPLRPLWQTTGLWCRYSRCRSLATAGMAVIQ